MHTKLARVGPKFYLKLNEPWKLPKISQILSKWWNFTKSGHNVHEIQSDAKDCIGSFRGIVVAVHHNRATFPPLWPVKSCQMSIKFAQK